VVTEFSAGGLCVRAIDGRDHVAAIRVKNGTVLALPKGGLEDGEEPADAARREVREEAGVVGEVVQKLGDVEYWYVRQNGTRVFKNVAFYLLSYLSGSVEDHDHEVDSAEWVPLEDAEALLQYKGEKQMVATALTAIQEAR
jgi:8-oxo-dGTP pyrophosphatase MutT (NUDIX family)